MIEKGKISNAQLVFLVAGYIQGATLTTAFAYGISKNDTWLTVLAGLAIILPVSWINMTLIQRFPGKNLIQINHLVYGPYVGKLLNFHFIFFFLTIVNGNIRFIADFLLTYIIPQTPLLVVLVMFTIVCAWAVKAGLEVIARCSVIFVVLTLIIVMLTVLFLIRDMKFANFLPVFSIPLKDFIQGTHIMATFPFGEIAVFLMIIPYLNKKNQTKSSMLLGALIGAGTLIIISVRDIAVLGTSTSIMVHPSFESVRLIDIANILTRLELFVALVLLLTLFLKASIAYYATVLAIAQLFNLRTYQPLLLPIGIISISYSTILFESIGEFTYSAANIWTVFNIPMQFCLPPFTLFIAKIRGLPGKQRG